MRGGGRPRRVRGGITIAALVSSCVGFAAVPLTAQGTCAGSADGRADWGIRYRFVSGHFVERPDGGHWIHFLTEPSVVSVAPGGPAGGRLRTGDVVESVDGHLITTLEGSRRFAFGTGKPVALGVRRSGETEVIPVSPRVTCAGASSPPRDRPGRGPRAPSETEAPFATGRSGFRLRCRGCGYEDGRWKFSSPPIVSAVQPGGPAGRAGLSIGDVLVAVDGAALTTDGGARRFSTLHPGERVVWTVRRGNGEVRLTWTIGTGGSEH